MQIGLSPKLAPAILLALLGLLVALLVDHDTGLTMLATAAVALGAGYRLPPGRVTSGFVIGTPNDELVGDVEPPHGA